MAIAPLEETTVGAEGPAGPLRLIPGGRPTTASRPGSALHARPDSIERSRAAHPSASARSASVGVPPVRESWWEDDWEVLAPLPAEVAQRRTEERAMARRAADVRARTLARRRRTLGVVVAVVALAMLAMPIRALGAVTLSGQATPDAVPGGLAPGSVYVVQPGDTDRSVAMRVNPAAAATIERQLVGVTGSTTLVPGEHLVIP